MMCNTTQPVRLSMYRTIRYCLIELCLLCSSLTGFPILGLCTNVGVDVNCSTYNITKYFRKLRLDLACHKDVDGHTVIHLFLL